VPIIKQNSLPCLKGTLVDDPTVYINITSKMEAGLAPEGCENWFVMINAPANRAKTGMLTDQGTKNIIDKLNRLLQNRYCPTDCH
jgi:phytoene dehydrogenase-like protein